MDTNTEQEIAELKAEKRELQAEKRELHEQHIAFLKAKNDKLEAQVGIGGWKYKWALQEIAFLEEKWVKSQKIVEELKEENEKLEERISNWHDANMERDEALDMVEELKAKIVEELNCDCCGNVPFDKKFTVVRDNGETEYNCEACYKEGYD